MASGQETVSKRAFAGAREVMGPEWKSANASSLVNRVVSGGLTNLLNLVQLVDPATGVVREEALVRLFGEGTEEFIDREVDNNVSCLMSTTGIAPKVYGSFEGGRVEEFINNVRMITHHNMREPVIFRQIARLMAQMHSIPLHECIKAGFRADEPTTPSMLKKLLHGAQRVRFDNCGRKAVRLASLELGVVTTEVEWLCEKLEETGMPKVLCHRDLQSGNVMVKHLEGRETTENDTGDDATENGSVYENASKEVMLIDFEYSGLDYVAFDFGNTFNEMSINNFSKRFPGFVIDPDLFPHRDQRKEFFKIYLEHFPEHERLFPGRMHMSNEQKLDKLCEYADLGTMASHLQWALWGIVQSTQSCIEFGHLEYSAARLDQYHHLRARKYSEE